MDLEGFGEDGIKGKWRYKLDLERGKEIKIEGEHLLRPRDIPEHLRIFHVIDSDALLPSTDVENLSFWVEGKTRNR